MAPQYYRCDGEVSTTSPSSVQCSTNWLAVTEPTFTLISREQADALFIGITTLVVVIVVFKKLGQML